MWIEKMQSFFKDKEIEGRNLEQTKAEFGLLTSLLVEGDEELIEPLTSFQESFINEVLEEGDKVIAKPMKIENNSVIIDEGTLFHVCPLKKSALEGIAVGGLLCSEWFGALESEGEGRFCAFLNTTNEKFVSKEPGTFVLYFDTNHPLMQNLVKTDYFEYKKRKMAVRDKLFDNLTEREKEEFYNKAKQQALVDAKKSLWWKWTNDEKKKQIEKAILENNDPEYIHKYANLLPNKIHLLSRKLLKEKYEYSDLILDMYDVVIDPLSPAGKYFHDDPNQKEYYWKAIPGGIPSTLINGIQMIKGYRGKYFTKEQIEEVQQIFPKAVVFDENKQVLSKPLTKIKY